VKIFQETYQDICEETDNPLSLRLSNEDSTKWHLQLFCFALLCWVLCFVRKQNVINWKCRCQPSYGSVWVFQNNIYVYALIQQLYWYNHNKQVKQFVWCHLYEFFEQYNLILANNNSANSNKLTVKPQGISYWMGSGIS
jgi:hypothetical protein